eukprot:6210610-Alexandrium_andersonii.AAC.1
MRTEKLVYDIAWVSYLPGPHPIICGPVSPCNSQTRVPRFAWVAPSKWLGMDLRNKQRAQDAWRGVR